VLGGGGEQIGEPVRLAERPPFESRKAFRNFSTACWR
jgi:hypothetical protein